MNVGTARVACQLWLGDTVEKPASGSVVAIKTSVGLGGGGRRGKRPRASSTSIERIEARPIAAGRKVIAVLDDDQDLTNSICAHFQASGYDARPFYKTADLLSSARVRSSTTRTSSTGSSARKAPSS